jgi:trimethylamine--corrinoid protein Co-methyltransferase
MPVSFATFLTPEEVVRIHEASLEVLETVGLRVRNENARRCFSKHGCPVDSEALRVRFPRDVVEDFRKAFPPTFTFHGRDPRYDRTIPADGPLIVTGSSAPNLIDPVTGQERRSRSEDIARIAHLIHELPGYDVFSISTLAEDVPSDQFSLGRFYPALKNCLKPVRGNTPHPEDLRKILRLGALIAGNEAAYRERPFITHHYCPVVSPLTMDVASTGMLMFLIEKGLPCFGSVVPNGGLTSPLTLTGTLVQGNAEFLALAVLTQMVRPGTSLIYSSLPTVADMRTGAYAPGAIETGILLMGFTQMAHYYRVPCGGYVGLTNAKINDAQSGFETGMSTVATVLAGMDMLNMGGLLDALMTFDFAKAVIDNEIALMLKHVKRGFDFSEENLSLDIIKEVGPDGIYMDKPETIRRMKITPLYPKIADRNPRQRWEVEGSLDAQDRAMKRVHEILGRENPAVFSPEVDARIRAELKGLVTGDSVPLSISKT